MSEFVVTLGSRSVGCKSERGESVSEFRPDGKRVNRLEDGVQSEDVVRFGDLFQRGDLVGRDGEKRVTG